MKARTVALLIVLFVVVSFAFSKVYPAINTPISIGTKPRTPTCAGFVVTLTAKNTGIYDWSLTADGHRVKNGRFTEKGKKATATVGPSTKVLTVSYSGTGAPAKGKVQKSVTPVAPCPPKKKPHNKK